MRGMISDQIDINDTRKGFTIIVPCYNSQALLPDLVCRVKKTMDKLEYSYELILINDGSKDSTWSVITELNAKNSWIQGINLLRNYGQHNALLAGIRSATFDVIVTIDDDLQNPPEEIYKLITKLQEGYDVVYGTPEKEEHGFLRDLASRITKIALQSIMGIRIARKVSAFRAFRTLIRNSFAAYSNPFVSIDVLLTWGTTRFSFVSVKHEPRATGSSNYTFRKLIVHALNMITGYSAIPLQFAGYLGFVFTVFGGIIFCFVILRYLLYGSVVPGFTFLAVTILIFSGVQLFALGIIGEYLARMHFRMMERPTYVVRERTVKK